MKNKPVTKDLVKNIKDIDNFDRFKDLKMVKNLSIEEKQQVFKIFQEDKSFILPTITGHKPGALVANSISPDILNKLHFDDVIDIVPKKTWHRPWGDMYNSFFLNRKNAIKTIDRCKDIFTTRLGLSKDMSSAEIYKHFINKVKSTGEAPFDLEGLILGFPKYDSMIYNLDEIGNLGGFRALPGFKDKILGVLNNGGIYKNLSPIELTKLKTAINNIKPENLRDIGRKGSYHNEFYAFIDYCSDSKELSRIANDIKSYKKFIGQ